MSGDISTPEAVQALRSQLEAAEAAGLEILGPCPPELSEAWIDIELPDGWKSRTSVVWPNYPPGTEPRQDHAKGEGEEEEGNNDGGGGSSSNDNNIGLPLLVYFHGGGFATGSPDQLRAPARGIAALLGCVVACPSHKKTPEHPFPAPTQSAWAACTWLSDPRHLNDGCLRGTGVEVDLGQGFVVGGLSSGGSIAAVVGGIAALSAGAGPAGAASSSNDDGEDADDDSQSRQLRSEIHALGGSLRNPITGIFSGLPLLLHESMELPNTYRDAFTSRQEFAECEGFNAAGVRGVEDNLRADYRSPWYSPLNTNAPVASSAVHQQQQQQQKQRHYHHPRKVFTYGCGVDPCRDDALLYARWLRELADAGAGEVEARVQILEGMNHTAWTTPPWPVSHADSIKAFTLDALGWLLGRKRDKSRRLPY
ncbi:Alpha/Beta hydrolase protein [Xylariales sp. PMI_506]|nr:Alpha/Beta hydrolase protein [Xylariales sp. PMI_506]